MALTVLGRYGWEGSRTEEGHRDYTVKFKVETDNTADGPQAVTFAAGLPAVGDPWTFGNDNDAWAFCTPFLKIEPLIDDEAGHFWTIEYKFTTRPLVRCGTTQIDNPLSEPDRIGGSFTHGDKKATKDRFGNLIQTTSFEPVPVEFDHDLPEVRIEQTVANLELDLFSPMVNNVNNATLWGLGPRKIRLSNVAWERRLYGVCTFYFVRTLDFDVDFDTFDREDIPNKGKKLLNGTWNDNGTTYRLDDFANVNNADDYIVGVDPKGNPTEYFLATDGTPSSSPTFLPKVEYHDESNFLLLGIPSSL